MRRRRRPAARRALRRLGAHARSADDRALGPWPARVRAVDAGVDDGRWWNFIYDWAGTRNETGLTSSTGENFWHARALGGVSHAWLTFGDERALAATRARARARRRAAGALRRPRAAPDRGAPTARRPLVHRTWRSGARWADEIAANRIGDVLMNNPDERGEPHLWAHVQEGVLVDAGRALDDPGLIDVACASARALVEAARAGRIRSPERLPVRRRVRVYSLERLARVDDGRVGGARRPPHGRGSIGR